MIDNNDVLQRIRQAIHRHIGDLLQELEHWMEQLRQLEAGMDGMAEPALVTDEGVEIAATDADEEQDPQSGPDSRTHMN